MSELNHKKIDLLKLDVEGAEYEIIDSILKDKLNIKILCLEFDEIPLYSVKAYFKTKKMLNKILNNGFKLIHQNDSDFVFVKNK